MKYEDVHKLLDGTEHKLCLECDIWLPCNLDHFYKNKSSSSDGLNPYCKKCTVKKSQKRYEEKFDEIQIYKQKWHIENREVVLERASKWAKENRESRTESLREFYMQNPDKVKAYGVDRRKKNHTISTREWENCKHYFNCRCAYCGLKIEEHYCLRKGVSKLFDFHKEHVDDMGVGDLSNCIPSCNSCNSSKWIHLIEDWYTEDNEVYSKERFDKIMKWLNSDYKLYIES